MAAAAVQARVAPVVHEARVARAILVVEDERFVNEVTCHALVEQGHSVLWARGAGEARRIFYRHAEQISVIVCDAVLPDGSGVDLAFECRRFSSGLKIVVASGYPPALLASCFQEESGATFLVKPYSTAALSKAMKAVLGEQVGAKHVA